MATIIFRNREPGRDEYFPNSSWSDPRIENPEDITKETILAKYQDILEQARAHSGEPVLVTTIELQDDGFRGGPGMNHQPSYCAVRRIEMGIVNDVIEESESQESGNNSFKLDTVTSPLLISDLWDYLINWYSQKNNLTAPKRSDEKVQFLIIEPYVDEFYKNQAMKKKALAAEMVSSEYFGGMAVQKWILK